MDTFTYRSFCRLLTATLFIAVFSFTSCAQAEDKQEVKNGPKGEENSESRNGLKNSKFEELKLKNGKTLKYAIHLPEDFDAAKAYPTIIGPGDGTKKDSPGYYWHGNPSEHDWIIVESSAHFDSDAVGTTRQLLDHISSEYKVEGDRFHMVGYSANSKNSFNVGIALAERFHSLVGVAGFPRNNPDKATVEKLKNTKFFFIVGDQDSYWMGASKKSHEYLKSVGLESYLEIIKDGQHVLRKVDGKPFMKLMERMR